MKRNKLIDYVLNTMVALITAAGVIPVLLIIVAVIVLALSVSPKAEAAERIRNRELVPDTYIEDIEELDPELARMMEDYNRNTAELLEYYTEKHGLTPAERYVRAFFYRLSQVAVPWPSGLLDPAWCGAQSRVPTIALYPDAYSRIAKDPILSLGLDGGNSGSMWAMFIHDAILVGEERAKQIEDYFALVDALLIKLG